MRVTLSNSFFALLVTSVSSLANNWPEFRGAGGSGHASGDVFPTAWSVESGDGIVWATETEGRGWSSPVVVGNEVWLTTAVEVIATEEEKPALLAAEGRAEKKFKQLQIAKRIELKALCYDYESGELTKSFDLFEIEAPDAIHNLNSYASPTPVLVDGLLFCHFGSFGTVCLNASNGERAWERKFEVEHGVGPGSSPVVWGGMVFLICDGIDQQYVVAVDKASGETVWRTERPEMRAELGDHKKAYNTPVVIPADEGDGRDQVVCMGAQWLVSYDPRSGDELWRVDHGKGFSVVPRPVVGHDKVFVATGFGQSELLAVNYDGSGDVTESHVGWTQQKRIPTKPSPLLVGDELYVLEDGGIMSCLDAETGESHWAERVVGNYSASPVFAGGNIYVWSQEGLVTVVKPGLEWEMVAEIEMGDGFMASPAAVGGDFIIRTEEGLYRVGSGS